ncbi:sphingosine 1-phosphate receptor 4-like [Actinia tenebrosa]|uniref:Sphingosine 1-phosphate receptor 4-like n=1 Tax=Actinia tenebrosa TaxID=6105 RepID=A0A6P8HUH9_ACTTE|nr:sphingosine 1-phosphate receptor 4-like [Actinia tenebrosa]
MNSTINSTARFPTLNVSNTSNVYRSLTIAQMIIYAVLGVFILVGNALCLAVFLKTKKLRKRSYYLLISLSVADLMVGLSASVICVEDGLSLFHGTKNVLFAFWRDVTQYFPRMCSLFTIATVALERFWAVGFPTKHRSAGTRPYVALIALPWILAVASTVLFISSGRRFVSEHAFNFVDVALSQATLLTIIIAYCGLLKKMRSNSIRSNKPQINAIRERKLAVTLFVVTLASLLTIYPVNIYFLFEIFCKNFNTTSSKHHLIFLIALASSNSGINIVVYLFRIPEFKRAVFRLVPWKKRRSSRVACSSQINDAAGSEHPETIQQETQFNDGSFEPKLKPDRTPSKYLFKSCC